LVEETREKHRPASSHWQTLSHNVVLITPRLSWIRTRNFSLFCHQKAFIDPAIVLSMFMLSIIFVILVVCGLFEWNNIGKVFLSYVYICIAVGDTVRIGGEIRCLGSRQCIL
jgi:hypothetical protein